MERFRYIAAISAIFIVSVAARPYDALLGKWQINLMNNSTKETLFSPGFPVPKSQVLQFEPVGSDAIRYSEDTTGPDGSSRHVEYTAQMDGKDYPVSGDPYCDSVSLQRVKPFIIKGTCKKSGAQASSFTFILWGSGTLLYFESNGTRDGMTYQNKVVYNKLLPQL